MRRVLVANRGEIVSRVARAAHARGLDVVAVFAESDRSSRYLRDADSAVFLGDDAGLSPYLDIDLLVQAARDSGADAVHPGYGFLAENAAFAAAVVAAGLTWIGPPASAIAAMGGKVRAKQIAREAGVPVLESFEFTGHEDLAGLVARHGDRMRPPFLVKPSAGGGGKGMHRVDSWDELPERIERASREAVSAFGDGTVFVESYLQSARHVEVQILADSQGNVVHLGTRDCSVQRRHQKIIEEAPAPGIDPVVRDRLCSAAVELARTIGYVGAGTVEYLVDGDSVAFLEMNTRLQVEHPVSEEVTGLDLVDLQLSVAAGEQLAFSQSDVRFEGHAVEVRIYAENPRADYLPSPGTIVRCDAATVPGVRWELGVEAGSVVSSHYDPMIAKVVATGRNRDEAVDRLRRALEGFRLSGVATNADQLVQILDDADFRAARLDTRFLDNRPALVGRPTSDGVRARHLAVATIAESRASHDRSEARHVCPPAWRNMPYPGPVRVMEVDGEPRSVTHRSTRSGAWLVGVDGEDLTCTVLERPSHDAFLVQIGSVVDRYHVDPVPGGVLVSSRYGHTRVVERDRADGAGYAGSGGHASPLPGTVVQVLVSVGEVVEEGDATVVVEAMKMEHRIRAQHDGVVDAVLVEAGDPVDSGQILVEIKASE